MECMSYFCKGKGLRLRPHVKGHMTVEVRPATLTVTPTPISTPHETLDASLDLASPQYSE